MISDMKYIIKRIIIGVGIALIVMLIRGNLIGSVQALSTYSKENGHILITVDNAEDLYNYDSTFYSNMGYNSSLSYQDVTALKFYTAFNTSYNSSGGYNSYLHNIKDSSTIHGQETGYTYNFYRLDMFFDGVNAYNTIYLDTEYSVLLKFQKSSSLTFNTYDGLNDHLYSWLTFYDHDSSSVVNGNEYVTIDDQYFISSTDSNYAFLVVNFHIDSNDFPFSSINYSLNQLSISPTGNFRSDGTQLITGNVDPFIINTTNNDLSFTTKYMIFVKGHISYTSGGGGGTGFGPDNYGQHSAEEVDIDIITESDSSKFEELEMCSDLDISCHIRNLSALVKNLFVRLGNVITTLFNWIIEGLHNLFVPSNEFLEDFLSDNYDFLTEKLGFLIYPFEVISEFLNRFLDLQTVTSISYNGYKYPGTDTYIIPSFSFDFNSLLSDNTFNTIYSYYMILISGFIVICFVNLCYRKYKSFIS